MKKLFFLTFIVFLFSCDDSINREKKNTYHVISLLYDQLAIPFDPSFPPPPNKPYKQFNTQDSLRIDSRIKRFIMERDARKQIVAVYPLLDPYKKGHHKYFMKNCSAFNNVMDKLLGIKDTLKIDIGEIITKRNDSIVYFKENLIIKGRKDYETFDILISFSRIAFNKDYTKAVLVGSVSTSTLAGVSILYFLEKIDDNWKIKCTKELSIS